MEDITKNTIVFDASCHIPNAHLKGRSKKGKSSCGILIIDIFNNKEYEFSNYLGEKTVPEAEFEALIFALDKASELIYRNEEIEVRGDSELVIKWMNGSYRLKKSHIKLLYDEAKKIESRFKKVIYIHQPRSSKLGQRVNKLAQEAYKKFIS